MLFEKGKLPSTDVQLTLSLNMTTAQVVENVDNRQQQSYWELHPPGRKYTTYLWNHSWVQSFHC